MKKIFFLAIAFALYSCSNDNSNNNVASNYDVGLRIYLLNSAGENLIDTQNYNSGNFKLYYSINNTPIEYYQPNLDYPYGFSVDYNSNPISLELLINDNPSDLFPITYVKWNETDTDTLKAYIYRADGLIVCRKLWLNDNLVWDGYSTENNYKREITITK